MDAFRLRTMKDSNNNIALLSFLRYYFVSIFRTVDHGLLSRKMANFRRLGSFRYAIYDMDSTLPNSKIKIKML